MATRAPMLVFGLLLIVGAVLVIVAAPDRQAWGPVVGGLMIAVAVAVMTLAAAARPRHDDDRSR